MDNYTAKDFGKLLKRNALQMRRIMLQSNTDVMRIYDRNLSELPITVDLYGSYARITDYCEPALSDEEVDSVCDIVSRMLYIEPERVVYHHREKLRGKEQHESQDEQSLIITVHEQGLQFSVDLKTRIDTGLFLDQMVARQALREISRGLRILNLFSYTGSFSVYAAAGGATEVVSVDLSATYSKWCQQNLADNGFSGTAYPCICQDALQHIQEAVKDGRKFDIVVFDPPSFSNSRKMEHDFDVQRDYIQFIQHIHALLVVGGKLLFSTNLGGFRFEKRKIRGYQIREVTRDIAAAGFSVKKSSLRSWILEKNEEMSMPLKQEETNNADVTEKSTEAADVAKQAPAEDNASMDTHSSQEDDPLVLNWDEHEMGEASDEKKNAKQRRYERRHPGETAAPLAEKQEQGEKEPSRSDDNRPRERRYNDRDERRPRRNRDDRSQSGRSFDRDRPPRRFDDRDDRRSRRNDDRPQGGRSFDRDRPPRRFDDRDDRRPRRYEDDRSSGGRSFDRDRPPRRFDDRDDRRPRRDDDRPQGGRSFDRDRPPRRFDDRDDRRPRRDDDRPQGGRSFDRDRPPRRFDDRDDRRPRRDDDRPQGGRSFDRDRPPRRFDDRDDRRPRRDDDRPQGGRSFDRDRPPRRFDDRDDRRPRRDDDRPQGGRSFDRDRPPRRFDDRDDRRPRRYEDDRSSGGRSFDRDRPPAGKKGPKPYGYDRFKPTRDRGSDKETFFRLEDEVDKDR